MNGKKRLAILFGGRSAEHEISLRSAANIVNAADREKYELVLISIGKKGGWYLHHSNPFKNGNAGLVVLEEIIDREKIQIIPGDNSVAPVIRTLSNREIPVDVMFPVLHGTCGEDGTVQGLLKLLNIPFIGAGVAGAAVGMDKDIMKRLLNEAGLPIGKFLVFDNCLRKDIAYDDVVRELGLPLFVKPCNLGSSVGVSKVTGREDFSAAIDKAFRFDRKIIIEANIAGREIECSVLGNRRPEVSLPGEILTTGTFYSYDAKYIDKDTSSLKMPADLPMEVIKELQDIVKKSYTVLNCEGFARVDCFITPENVVIINEINTIPGFTSISMYPKLWELNGISTSGLIDKLVDLAFQRFLEESAVQTSVGR